MSNSLAERGRPAHATINPWTWQEAFGYSQAIEVRPSTALLYCAGQAAIAPDGTVIGPGDLRTQLAASLDNLETVLAGAGRTLSDVVRLNIYTTDVDGLFANYDVLLERLAGRDVRPASTLLGVSHLAFPEMVVELEATAAY
jgi:enamine deaminase RidA (YjgF/YER057c/UK114 family)